MITFLPEEEANKQFSIIGKFIVAYEDINSMMRHIITTILLPKNSKEQQKSLFTFLFHFLPNFHFSTQ